MFLSYRWRYCVQVEWTCEPLDSPSSCELTDILISLIVVHARLVYIHTHTMTKCDWGYQQNLSGLWPSRQNKRSFGCSARWHCIASGWIPAFFVFLWLLVLFKYTHTSSETKGCVFLVAHKDSELDFQLLWLATYSSFSSPCKSVCQPWHIFSTSSTSPIFSFCFTASTGA